MPRKCWSLKTGRSRKREEKLKTEGWIIVSQWADFAELNKKTLCITEQGGQMLGNPPSLLLSSRHFVSLLLPLSVFCSVLCCSEDKPRITHSVSIYIYICCEFKVGVFKKRMKGNYFIYFRAVCVFKLTTRWVNVEIL